MSVEGQGESQCFKTGFTLLLFKLGNKVQNKKDMFTIRTDKQMSKNCQCHVLNQ